MSAYLHFQVKDILPVQNLMENMLWTVLHKSAKTNTINQIGMGLLFLNILHFADSITFRTEEPYEGNLVFSLLQYIETHYKDGSLEGYAAGVGQPVYYLSRLLKKHTGLCFQGSAGAKKAAAGGLPPIKILSAGGINHGGGGIQQQQLFLSQVQGTVRGCRPGHSDAGTGNTAYPTKFDKILSNAW